jgi:hypothetical protein
MKLKLLALATTLLLLPACNHSLKQTAAQYERLPIKGLKDTSKEGKSCGKYVFPISIFYTNFDLSVESARKNGDISEIVSIEDETKVIYPFYVEKCTIVKGN